MKCRIIIIFIEVIYLKLVLSGSRILCHVMTNVINQWEVISTHNCYDGYINILCVFYS